MAKRDKEYELRMQGMLYALEIAKNNGVEALEKEMKMRGVTRAEITCKEEDVRKMYQMMSQNVYINMLTVVCWTLKENFGFGKQRLQKLKTAFDANAQIIQDLDYMGQPQYHAAKRPEDGYPDRIIIAFDDGKAFWYKR